MDFPTNAATKAIAYDGTNFWILISDGSFKKLDENFTVVESYPKSAAIPGDLVYSVHYYDIAVNAANVYIAYNGCTDSSGSSSKYKSCIAKYNLSFGDKITFLVEQILVQPFFAEMLNFFEHMHFEVIQVHNFEAVFEDKKV